MASAIGTGKKGLDIELNIVPFIDVMSCLTAFLLVTAVWTGVAQERTNASARCSPGARCDPDPDARWLAVLVESERTSVLVMPHGDSRELAPNDWAGVGDALRALAPHANSGVQIAVESTRAHPLAYQTLVHAMDTAVKAGFADVSVTDARDLMR